MIATGHSQRIIGSPSAVADHGQPQVPPPRQRVMGRQPGMVYEKCSNNVLDAGSKRGHLSHSADIQFFAVKARAFQPQRGHFIF